MKTKQKPTERTGQQRLVALIETVAALRNAMLPMTSAQAAVMWANIARELTAANTEIAAEMAELIAAKPTHCCCDKDFGPKYQYSGLCDTCYEDRIA